MKIIYIVPGFGGTFYCQNCIRDSDLARAMGKKGQEVLIGPMYMPLRYDVPRDKNTPLFYGAINVYLREMFPFIRHIPDWIRGIFNSKPLLNYLADNSNSTDPRGLEQMTLSVLRGEQGRQQEELEMLVDWLKKTAKPDLVHFSNAMLAGLAKRIKEEIHIPIFCTFQDENTWIDRMAEPYPAQAWEAIKESAKYVDKFISVSENYKRMMMIKTGIPSKQIDVVPIGIPVENFSYNKPAATKQIIGFLSRIAPELGFDILVDAFIELKQGKYPDLRLRVSGGYAPGDRKFIRKEMALLKKKGMIQDVEFVPELYVTNLREFFKGLTLVSVPVPDGEAFGVFQIESMLSGIPVVEPDAGGYSEVIKKAKGGIIYKPNTAQELANQIRQMLDNPKKLETLSRIGHEAVLKEFNINRMVDKLLKVYRSQIGRKRYG